MLKAFNGYILTILFVSPRPTSMRVKASNFLIFEEIRNAQSKLTLAFHKHLWSLLYALFETFNEIIIENGEKMPLKYKGHE